MNGLLYSIFLQWKMDIRSRTLAVTCYLVPLFFFLLMGGIFTSVMPDMKQTLIPSMIVMAVSMGAFIGLPPTILETYGTTVKRAYRAGGIPLYSGVLSMVLSTFVHLTCVSILILLLAPVLFHAERPENLPLFFLGLALFLSVSLSISSLLGMTVKSQARLTMVSQLFFLPSIMLSGIMFPAQLLPDVLEAAGKLFPAFWGYRLLRNGGFTMENIIPCFLFLLAAAVLHAVFSKKSFQS